MVIRRTSREAAQDESSPGVPTVSELTRELAAMLESRFTSVQVQGEVSGWTRAASGHTYFTLKDENACLSAVLWRTRTLLYPIREGMKVVATGRIAVYAPRGVYQLDCVSLTPVGAGDLQAAFEALKQRLKEEGLFDAARKRPLPAWPTRIGVVTSRDGAVVRDIVTTLRRRMPLVEVVLRPALVQGAAAAADIVRGIDELNALGDVDVIIVGRGGGSIEDLWAFNEEVVARAIAGSRTPVISAVGHETDFTIADFVADVRAATPTAAAELAVRDRSEVLEFVRRATLEIHAAMQDRLASARRELGYLMRSRGLARPLDIVRQHQQRVDDLTHRAGLGLRSALLRSADRLRLAETALHALSPLNVLRRGYAIVERDGAPVPRAAGLRASDEIAIIMFDGSVGAHITQKPVLKESTEA